jgi:hypothetical protein
MSIEDSRKIRKTEIKRQKGGRREKYGKKNERKDKRKNSNDEKQTNNLVTTREYNASQLPQG